MKLIVALLVHNPTTRSPGHPGPRRNYGMLEPQTQIRNSWLRSLGSLSTASVESGPRGEGKITRVSLKSTLFYMNGKSSLILINAAHSVCGALHIPN